MTTKSKTETAAADAAAQPAQGKPADKKAAKPGPEPNAEKAVPTPGKNGADAAVKKATRKKAAAKPKAVTVRELAERYLAKLEEDGKAEGTIFSYRMELRLALEALGEDTPVTKITPAKVKAFFESDRVTKTKTGVEKSPLSIAKSIRVCRQLLAHAVELKILDVAPLPNEA